MDKNMIAVCGRYYGFRTSTEADPGSHVLYYYTFNAQGDVTGFVDYHDNLMARYEYDAWGKVLSVKDANGNDVSNNPNHLANINPIRYRGYYYDTETGFYFLQSRYYDPETGRFINADGLVDTGTGLLGNNMFSYCNNNPVNMCDKNGCAPKDTLKDAVEEAAYAITAVVLAVGVQLGVIKPSKGWSIPEKVPQQNVKMIKELTPKTQVLT